MRDYLIRLIQLYQIRISPVIKPACRFKPTCSEYAMLSLRKYNLAKAIALIIFRILRCNPLTKKESIDFP